MLRGKRRSWPLAREEITDCSVVEIGKRSQQGATTQSEKPRGVPGHGCDSELIHNHLPFLNH
jgi:hypothetical protein